MFQLRAIKFLICLVPFISLYISSSMVFPYITGKNFAFRILVELAAALWLGLLTANRTVRPRFSIPVISVLVFTCIAGLADLFGVSPYTSFWSNVERMDGYITLLHLTLYFLMLSSLLRTDKDWTRLLHVFIVTGVLVSLYALAFVPSVNTYTTYTWEYGGRIMGTIGNPPFLASYLLLSAGLAVIAAVRAGKGHMKVLYLIPALMNIAVVYLTASRGAILAVVMGVFIFCVLYAISKKGVTHSSLLRKSALYVLLIIVLISALWIFFGSDAMLQDRTISRFKNMMSDVSVQTRFDAWEAAWNGIKERPILGWGQENFVSVYSVSEIPRVMDHVWLDRAHNIFIEWLVSAGVTGLISYIVIFIAAFYSLWTACKNNKISSLEAVTVATLLMAYIIQNLFSFDTINTYIIFFTLLAYIDTRSGPVKDVGNISPKSATSQNRGWGHVSVSAALLLVALFVIYNINYKPMKQAAQVKRISDSFEGGGSFAVLLKEFRDDTNYHSFIDADVRERMYSVSNHILKKSLFRREGALDFIQATVEEMGGGIKHNRTNLEYLTKVIILFKNISRYEPSYINATETLIKECMQINPGYRWLYWALGDLYMIKKEFGKAFIHVKKIVDLDPDDDRLLFKLALAALYNRDGEVTENTLEKVIRIREMKGHGQSLKGLAVFSLPELDQLFHAYINVHNPAEALRYLEEIIDLLYDELNVRNYYYRNPSIKAKYHIERAGIYQKMGKHALAAKEAEKALEIDPSRFQGEAEKFID